MTLVLHAAGEVRPQIAFPRAEGRTIGFVPTMGALHAGHARLIEAARAESDVLVVSIFVNPLQFGPTEDLGRYPRTMDSDLELCRQCGADIVFAPTQDEMYPSEPVTFVDVTRISDHLCGKFREGHFRGVATVVTKLFNIVQPDRAYFGEKDFQQMAVIRRMVTDLNMPVVIVGVPTVREHDGLALSSRNRYLSERERASAPGLYRALLYAEALIRTGEKNAERVRNLATEDLQRDPTVRIEYFEIVDPDDIQPVGGAISGPVRVAGAVWIGNTRLIDNVAA
jgi:pantoate--beta-alanine ligase